MSAAKDIIYIDIDDEITSIIDKVQGASAKIVALVLPKRAAVLQSVVNMKLLKRSADEAGKNLVLITSEASLMPLAGAVGVHVAKTLQTRPVIPTAPKIHDGNIEVDAGDEPIDAHKPIGLLAGLRGRGDDAEEETIEVDNTDDKAEVVDEPVKPPRNKKLKVPNFNKFRTRLILGGAGLIAVLLLWYVAAFVMPRATIVIKTDTSSETSSFDFKTDPALKAVDIEERILPSFREQTKKSDSEKVTATGKKDNGKKATGSITVRNCDYATGFTIAAGSTFTSNGKSFISDAAAAVPAFSGPASSCSLSGSSSGKATVNVTAQSAGDSYNIAAASYSVPGIPSTANVDAVGSAMTGGTSDIIKVLSQKDFEDAQAVLEERQEDAVEDDLKAALEAQGYFVLPDSLVTSETKYEASPKVGEEAEEATITSSVIYTMLGVKRDDIDSLIKDSVKDAIGDDETIQSTGLEEAIVRFSGLKASGKANGTVQSIVVVGPKLDIEILKKEIAGQKRSPTIEKLRAHTGVQDVTVKYSPFWVFSTPGRTGKISITIEQANPTPAAPDDSAADDTTSIDAAE